MTEDFRVVHTRTAGTGPATAATRRCLWGALATAIALPALHVSGVGHEQLGAGAVGLLTLLPRFGPAAGVLLAALLIAAGPEPIGALPAAALLTLVGVPAQHLPSWLGPLSAPAAAAAVLFGGALAAVPGALVALLTSSALAALLRRHAMPVPVRGRLR